MKRFHTSKLLCSALLCSDSRHFHHEHNLYSKRDRIYLSQKYPTPLQHIFPRAQSPFCLETPFLEKFTLPQSCTTLSSQENLDVISKHYNPALLLSKQCSPTLLQRVFISELLCSALEFNKIPRRYSSQNQESSRVWIGLDWIGLVWFGLVWVGLERFGLVWIGLERFGTVWFGFGFYSDSSPSLSLSAAV